MRIPPNINPGTFTLSAYIIGYLMTIDLTILEQVAIANWLGLIGQVMGANAAQMLLLDSRRENENAINEFDIFESGTNTGNRSTNSNSKNSNNNKSYNYYFTEKEELEIIKKALGKIQKQLDEIMKE